MKYARELIYGAVGYTVGVAILRSLPSVMPVTFDVRATAFAIGSIVLFGALAWIVTSRRPVGERLASGAAMALPVLTGDALETANYRWSTRTSIPPRPGCLRPSCCSPISRSSAPDGWPISVGPRQSRAQAASASSRSDAR